VIGVVSSKPLIVPPDSVKAASAIIPQFSPGHFGGQLFAETLVGTLNPCGKLTMTIPLHAGQRPVYYNAIRIWFIIFEICSFRYED
jgi:beta-glucosidase